MQNVNVAGAGLCTNSYLKLTTLLLYYTIHYYSLHYYIYAPIQNKYMYAHTYIY